MKQRRHEKPIPRKNPSGDRVWVARWTNRHGGRASAGTFKLKGPCRAQDDRGMCCAQHRIDFMYDQDTGSRVAPGTVADYVAQWTKRHPRSERTNKTNEFRIGRLLDVELEGVKLRHWPMGDLRPRHVVDLVDHLLRVEGRAAEGAQGILRAYSAMWTDAVRDDRAEMNPFREVRVRANDPRVRKEKKALRVCTWDEMHAFAAVAARPGVVPAVEDRTLLQAWRLVYAEAMIRTLSDAGVRLGELLPLERQDVRGAGACSESIATKDRGVIACPATVPHLHVRRTAHEGTTQAGTKTTHETPEGGRAVPLAPALEVLLRGLPARIDTPLLFPTPTGGLWRERNFYRDVWDPARDETKLKATPHAFRHSWITLLQAAGVDHADLAEMAGHTVETMHGRYSHALGRSFTRAAEAVGA